jgi:uncharacterized membrane protein
MNKFKFIKTLSLIGIHISITVCILDLLLGDYILAALMAGAAVLNVHYYNRASQLEDLQKKD